jgi:hypothetical protein
MGAIIAGWVAGYAMSLVTTVALVYLAFQFRMHPAVERRVDPEVPGLLLAVPISTGAAIAWTLVGVLLGMLYHLGELESQRGGLGSPSMPFSVSMLIVSLFPVPPLLAVAWRFWWLWLGLSFSFAALFGWMLPILAGRW